MKRIACLLCTILACRLASAAGQSAAAKRISQKAPMSVESKSGEVDVMATVLESCSPGQRRAFLGSVKFLGGKILGFDYGAIKNCLGGMTRDAVSNRLALVGHDQARDDKDAQFGELFPDCSARARNAFYDGLSFRDGRVIGLFTGDIKKCAGKTDLHRFLSIFGAEGLEESDFKNDCACPRPGVCVPNPKYSCRP